jgi:DNA-binding IclR family transcriptional regulator
MLEWLPAALKGIGDAGLAKVLREKIELLEMQRAQAAAERDALATQLAQAREKIEVLNSQQADLHGQLENARQETLKQPQTTIDEQSAKLLAAIAHSPDGLVKEELFQHFSMPTAKGDFYFDELIAHKFIRQTSVNMYTGIRWGATPAGRAYLNKFGAL